MNGESRQEAPVPVQLTPIAPVRVYDTNGEYFDTEVDVDAPLRSLQLAIEDYFKIKPEVQLILHNRQQVYTERSMRDNGCLLLKGDPFVKLVCAVKRGPVLNLRCELGTSVYAIACPETATIWAVKKLLCDEMERQRRRGSEVAMRRPVGGPERLRLLWRYMELNDKATLHYYRVPTNATFTVMHRRRPVGAPPEHDASQPQRAAAGPSALPNEQRATPASGPWWQSSTPPPAPYEPRVAPIVVYPPQYSAAAGAAVPPPASSAVPPAPPPPPPLRPATTNYDTGSGGGAPWGDQLHAGPKTSVYQPAPPSLATASTDYYRAGHATAQPSPPLHSHLSPAELTSLSSAVQSIEVQLAVLRQQHAHVEQQQQHMATNQYGCLLDAQQRIMELEETVQRFYALMQRAVDFIPNH